MCVSRWSFTKNHNMMHSEQNVKNLSIPNVMSINLHRSDVPYLHTTKKSPKPYISMADTGPCELHHVLDLSAGVL